MTPGAGKAAKGQLQGRKGQLLPQNDRAEEMSTREESSQKRPGEKDTQKDEW